VNRNVEGTGKNSERERKGDGGAGPGGANRVAKGTKLLE